MFKKSNKRFKRKIEYEYSENNILIATGKKNRYSGKYGKWKVYSEEGELIEIEHYKLGYLNGIKYYLKEKRREKYRFGLIKNQLLNSKGKHYVFYFTMGMPSFRDYTCETEKFACQILPIAGCGVTYQLQRIQRRHNFLVSIKQIIRFGFHWKRNLFDIDC